MFTSSTCPHAIDDHYHRRAVSLLCAYTGSPSPRPPCAARRKSRVLQVSPHRKSDFPLRQNRNHSRTGHQGRAFYFTCRDRFSYSPTAGVPRPCCGAGTSPPSLHGCKNGARSPTDFDRPDVLPVDERKVMRLLPVEATDWIARFGTREARAGFHFLILPSGVLRRWRYGCNKNRHQYGTPPSFKAPHAL